METLQEQIESLQQSVEDNFKAIRSENDEIFRRLEMIEKMVDANVEQKDEKKTSRETEHVTDVNEQISQAQTDTQRTTVVKSAKTQKQKQIKKRKPSTKLSKKEVIENIEGSNVEDCDEDEQYQMHEEFSMDFKIAACVDDDDDDTGEGGEDLHIDDGQRHDVEIKIPPVRVFEGCCFRPLTGWKNANGAFEISKEIIQFAYKMVTDKIINKVHNFGVSDSNYNSWSGLRGGDLQTNTDRVCHG